MDEASVDTTLNEPEIKVSLSDEEQCATSGMPEEEESALLSGQLEESLLEPTDEEPLVRGNMMMCPWCGGWQHVEAYTQLQIPPDFSKQATVIYKCSGERGCKSLFALKA